jgi:hypothetical protein
MKLSGALLLDRDDVYQNLFARHRAHWLYCQVLADVMVAPELSGNGASERCPEAIGPFRTSKQRKSDRIQARQWRTGHRAAASPDGPGIAGDQRCALPEVAKEPLTSGLSQKDTWWRILAEVAEGYPKLLVWLTEGQVTERGLRNVFGLWVALLRRIPGFHLLIWHFMFKPVSTRAPWRPALYEAILQDTRERLNSQSHSPCLEPDPVFRHNHGGTTGLSPMTDLAVLAPTAVCHELNEKVAHLATGCIGISGLRGTGKTSLIQDFCSHHYGTPRYGAATDNEQSHLAALRGLRIVVDAPLRFDAREFLIHLYSSLCQAVLADVRFNSTSLPGRLLGPVLLPRSARLSDVAGALSGIGFLALAFGLAYRAVGGTWPVPPWPSSRAWEWVGVLACLIGAAAAVGWRTRLAMVEIRQVTDIRADAEERLRRLHFQRTDARTSAGTLSPARLGATLSVGASHSLTEQMMSLPELIDDYRDFAKRVVAAMLEAHQVQTGAATKKPDRPNEKKIRQQEIRLIIGIDEMDQIENPGAACVFLEELSAAFGTSNCVYLLAIAPSTLAAVDRRTVPLKTASGGLFDEMVWVEPLTLEEAVRLLDARVIGMPPAFVALCYVMSGGVPRELLRVARAVTVAAEKLDPSGQGLALGAAAEHVIKAEIRSLRHRAVASAAAMGVRTAELGIGDTFDWLEEFDRTSFQGPAAGIDSHAWIQDTLTKVCGPWTKNPPSPDDPLAAVAVEIFDCFVAGLFFLLTVLDLFTRERTRADGSQEVAVNQIFRQPKQSAADATSAVSADRKPCRESSISYDSPALRDLARAHVALSASPQAAASYASQARKSLADPRLLNDPQMAIEVNLHFLAPPPADRQVASRILSGMGKIKWP